MGLVGSLIIGSVGTKLFGSYLQHRAAKKASEQQQQAGQQALALQQQQYQQTRQDLGPYREQGGQGLTALTALLGLPAAAPPTAAPSPWQPAIGSIGAAAHGLAPTAPGIPGAPPPAGGGGMVLLKAPNGQTRPVPAQFADYYLARGATRA